MKKGFTLIELLAVIVILAIIALIAVPTITGLVEKAKKGGAKQSANGYNDAINKQIALNLMDSNDENNINEGIIDAPFDSKYNLRVKGQEPTNGWVEVTKNGVNRYSLVIGDYVVSYDGINKTVIKGNTPNKKPKETVVYRFSSDDLYIGDKIDLQNRKYTNYTKYDEEQDKVVSIDETHDMVGIYSKNINDVLNINMNYDGTPIESKSNFIYLKHTLDSDDRIVKSEACIKTSWETLCQESLDNTYDWEANSYKDSDYDAKKNKLLNFFKWNSNTNTSEYSGFTCSVGSSNTYCTNYSSHVAKIWNTGDFIVTDDILDIECNVLEEENKMPYSYCG